MPPGAEGEQAEKVKRVFSGSEFKFSLGILRHELTATDAWVVPPGIEGESAEVEKRVFSGSQLFC